MKFHLKVELNKKDVKRVEKVLAANDMSIKEFAGYAIAAVAQCHSGHNVKI